MRWDIQTETNNQKPYSTLDTLFGAENSMQGFAYCLPRYSKLNGDYTNAPDSIPYGLSGYISSSLSDDNCNFADVPTITVRYDRLKTSNGIQLRFNLLSGDYVKKLKISWLKDGTLVKAEEYNPTSFDYFCAAKVKLFDTVKIEFLQTSKPYRYIWLSAIRNQRMSNAGGLKIVYDDIALGAKEDSSISSADKKDFVILENLKEVVEYPNYAMCLPRYSKLDGTYVNTPGALEHMGYISRSVSDSSGRFANPPTLEFRFTKNFSSVGISLEFNNYSEDYCSKVNIKWYSDNTLLKEQEYNPDSYKYFCYGVVDFYNRVVITFLETSKPFRNAFLTGITWGLIRIFKDDEIESIDCLVEIDGTSKEISVNTMEYSVRDKMGYDFEFQKKQKQTLYFDEAILGIFYLKDGKQLSNAVYSMETHDAIGILDGTKFMGGVYDQVKAKQILESIMQDEGIPHFIDTALENKLVSGYLPICSKRAALQQLAFAIGAVVDTSYDRNLYLYPMRTTDIAQIKQEELFTKLSFSHSDVITGIKLAVHEYLKGDETMELFKGYLVGNTKIEFSEPIHSLTIHGGSITEQGDNYARISGTGVQVVLSGKKYIHNTFNINKDNDRVTHNRNIAEVKKATLVTKENMQEVLERIYNDCIKNESISCRLVVDNHELGDLVEIDTFKGKRQGIITKLDFKFSRNEITAEAVIR
nr:MAG TPA: hypothetical protein [Caudoviricetes sp.]